jgi:hypothetical protein
MIVYGGCLVGCLVQHSRASLHQDALHLRGLLGGRHLGILLLLDDNHTEKIVRIEIVSEVLAHLR